MKTDTHGNGNGLNDLYVLYETESERKAVIDRLRYHGRAYCVQHSNPDCEWYGKAFIESPFSEDLREEIESLEGSSAYKFRFVGRKIGASGVTYPATLNVCGPNPQEAQKHIWAHYEHVSEVEQC